MDIRFYDESYYLTQGLFQPIQTWIADYSALYSLYYKGLAFFQSDEIKLYYLNYRVWAFVLSAFIFVWLRLFQVNFWIAFIWSLASFIKSTELSHLAKSRAFGYAWGWNWFIWLAETKKQDNIPVDLDLWHLHGAQLVPT